MNMFHAFRDKCKDTGTYGKITEYPDNVSNCPGVSSSLYKDLPLHCKK